GYACRAALFFITPSARPSRCEASSFEFQALGSRTTLLHDTRTSACYPAMAAGDLAHVGAFGMSKQHEAELILKLYELRRDETMRKARDWFFLKFHPESMADFNRAMFSDHSGHLRMVMSYWDMAAALVN